MVNRFQRAWRHFVRGGKVATTFASWEANWPRRSHYLSYVISLAANPKNQPVIEAVREIQRDLQLPYVTLVPPKALHVSVQGVDFLESLTPEQARALVVEGEKALRGATPFTLRIRNANSFPVAAFLEAHDHESILDLRARLRAALPWLADEGRDPFVRHGRDEFLPHLSIGYYEADLDNKLVVEALRKHRRREVGEVEVTSVQLVRVPKPTVVNRWRWPVEATFELNAPTAR